MPQHPSPFAGIDAIAAASLSAETLTRYRAYKEILLAREKDPAAIIFTLTLFVSDLSEAADATRMNRTEAPSA